MFSKVSATDYDKSPAEIQYEQTPYESTFDDWDEIVIQFGYLALFAVAFPLAPALALLSNWFENYIDSKKLCDFFRRPLPKGAADIGMWYSIFNIVSFFSVITYVAIIVFETHQFEDYDTSTQWLIFVFAEHAILLAKGGISYLIPDESNETRTHLDRQQYLANVLIGGVEDGGADVEISEDVLLGKAPEAAVNSSDD